MEFYLATKKNEILSLTSNWVELENIIQSEVSQVQKALGRVGISGREKELGKRYGRVNIVQVLSTHVCKWENETC
jgi:hypothetical protein